jgi:hypothetical protein
MSQGETLKDIVLRDRDWAANLDRTHSERAGS